MFHRTSSGNQKGQRVGAVLRALFAVYMFFYFYALQDEILSLAQHRLSGGQTVYHPLVGALVLTLLLVWLQNLMVRLFSAKRSFSAKKNCSFMGSALPSALIAVLLTAFTPEPDHAVLLVSGLVAAGWGVWAVRTLSRNRAERRTTQYAPSLLAELVGFFLTVLFMGVCSGNRDVTAYEVQAARAISGGNYSAALAEGRKSLATSRYLTALRAYALSHSEGGLGNGLFAFPIADGGSDVLYLYVGDTLTGLFPPAQLHARLGYKDGLKSGPAMPVLRRAAAKRPHTVAKDYYLCGLLLDKDIETFAQELPHFYELSDTALLPRYYAEAMILYNRVQPSPGKAYSDNTISANYMDFKEKERSLATREERRNLLWREYGTTYWWYYFYH